MEYAILCQAPEFDIPIYQSDAGTLGSEEFGSIEACGASTYDGYGVGISRLVTQIVLRISPV
jgi:hypothetical protein